MSRRADGTRDSSIACTSESRLQPIALVDGNNYVIGFTDESEDFADPLKETPLYLIVNADGDFYAGEQVTDSSVNKKYFAGIDYSFPIAKRSEWNFRRDGDSTVNIRGVLYMGD